MPVTPDPYTVVVGKGRKRHAPVIGHDDTPLCRPALEVWRQWAGPIGHLPVCEVCRGAVNLGTHPLLPVRLRKGAA